MPVERSRFFQFPWRSRRQIARDLDVELEFHLTMRTNDLIARGMAPDEARRRAREEFGDIEFTKAYCNTLDEQGDRAMRSTDRLAELRQDASYAWRTLRRSPGFTTVSLLTLALAIGANTAMFSVARAVLLRPLPYGAPDALLALYERSAQGPDERDPLSVPDFIDYRAQQRTLTDIAAYMQRSITWRPEKADPAILRAVSVTANMFTVLRVGPFLGSTFVAGDDSPAGTPKVVASYAFWQGALGGDPAIVGRSITLNGRSHLVIGVMPRALTLGLSEDVWLPLDLSEAMADPTRSRKQHYLNAVARLKPDVTLDAARTDLLQISRKLAAQYPEAKTGQVTSLLPLHEAMTGEVRPALLLLQGGAGLVLLIACANLANVTLSRTMGRRRELAVRASIGAGRGRIARQLLTESVLLSVIGGAIGIGLAVVSTKFLLGLNPDALPPMFADAAIDGRVLLFNLALSVATGILFGLIPAVDATHLDLNSSLKEGGRGSSGGRGGERLRRILVVTQVGVAVVLLVGAGILIRSFGELTKVRLGFDPAHVITAQLSAAGTRYDSSTAVNQFYDGVLDAVAKSPGVVAVGASMGLPLIGVASSSIAIAGEPFDATNPPGVLFGAVRGDYFKAMGIPLKSGRLFDATDRPDGPQTAIINEAAAKRFFPNGDAIGRRIRLGPDPKAPWISVVGIAGDMHQEGLDVAAKPTVFVNHRQATWVRSLAVVIRTTGESNSAIAALRRAVSATDPALALRDVRTLDAVVGSSLAARRFALVLASCLAVVALVLAAVGIYGVLAYAVASRSREFGVRLALGATTRNVLGLVLQQGFGWSLLGLVLGIGGALAGGRLLTGMLYGVTPTDATTFLGVTGVLLAVVLLACLVPAIRATKVDPSTSMRTE